MPNILDEFVDKDFVPKREDEIMVDGSNLKNGMRVLIADTTARMSIDELLGENPEPRYVFMLRKYNRWCTISNVRRNGKKLSFTGTYDDGSMYRHDASYQSIWYVDRASMVDRSKKKRAEVRRVLTETVTMLSNKPSDPMTRSVYEDAINRIYTILDIR